MNHALHEPNGRRFTPADWDGLSFCVNLDGNPATHRRLAGFDATGVAIVEMVCCSCSGDAS